MMSIWRVVEEILLTLALMARLIRCGEATQFWMQHIQHQKA